MQRFAGLLDGRATFAADLPIADVLQLVFVRSPHAHARIANIDTSAACAMPGVVAVFRAQDLPMIPVWEIHIIAESLGQPPLAVDVVRYVGERVVAVVADSLAHALDAAEAVIVDYEPLDAVLDVRHALDADAPVLHPQHGTNLALDWATGPTTELPEGCIVVEGAITMERVAVAPMEPLSIVVVPGADDTLLVHPATQSPHGTRVQLARSLNMAYTKVRVAVPAVGGGFGGKAIGGIVDYVVCAAAARALRRPVRFVEQRSDNLVCMQGRGMQMQYRMHATPDGIVRGIEVTQIADCGAYPTTNAVEPGKTQLMASGPYRIDHVRFRATSVMSNLAPSGAYRGPGRSEASAVLEAALDALARELCLDPFEIRRRNLLVPDDSPRVSPTGTQYDGTDFVAMVERAIDVADYVSLRAEQHERRRNGQRTQLGIGVASIIDSSAWFARDEFLHVTITDAGRVQVRAISASAGQDHAPAYAAIVARVLPVTVDDIDVIEGDTEGFHAGFGSSGSRTVQLAGSAIHVASTTLRERLCAMAAHHLEASVDDIVVSTTGFAVRGVPARELSVADLERLAATPGALAPDIDSSLDAPCTFEQAHATYPSMVCVAVVEIDVDTGEVTVRELHAVADCGTVIDPPNAEGQVLGANVQAIGQVLFEEVRYDEFGTAQNASLAEYLVVSAAEVPPRHTVVFTNVAASVNPLGAKGVGELGMVATPAAMRSAVLDALAPYGVAHVDLPCTPERVWRALNAR